MHAALAAVRLVKSEDTFAANRRDDGVIWADRPKGLCKIVGTRRETIPTKNDEGAHCSEP
jgi:hypothetical protein